MDAESIRSIFGAAAVLLAAPVLPADSVSVAWHGTTEIAQGGGTRGPWRQNQSRYDYVDDPTVAIDHRGEIFVAWVDQARKDVFFQRLVDGGKRPPGPVDVSRNPATFSWLPRIALAPDDPDRIFVLWQEIIFSGGSHGGDILFARSTDGGNTFSEPVNLSESKAGDGKGRIHRDYWHNGSLDIVAGKDGDVYAAWTAYEGALWFSRSTDGGARFSRPRRVAGDDERPARAPSLALGGDGGVYMAWTVGEDDAADIRVARSTDGGATFSEPRLVAPNDGYADAPKLALDASGTVHLAYSQSAGRPLDPTYHVHYTRSTDRARSFESVRVISDPLPQRIEGAAFPALSVDAQANVYVLWELFPEPRNYPRGLGFAVSRDGGRRFTAPVVVPGGSDPAGGTNGSHQGLLTRKLAVNDAGSVAIVNSSLKRGSHSRVWLMRATHASVSPSS